MAPSFASIDLLNRSIRIFFFECVRVSLRQAGLCPTSVVDHTFSLRHLCHAMELYAPDASIESLAALMRGRRTVVLSGAGMSTESGIPDYRGPQGSLRARMPMSYRDFVRSAENAAATGRAVPVAGPGCGTPGQTPATRP